MSNDPRPNADQVKFWTEDAGPRWVAMQERCDAQLRPLGQAVMEAARIQQGERILDVGAGCGDTTLDLARRVGPSGHVHAVDISPMMLERARERAQREALANVSFQLADAQVTPMEQASHDMVFSRFGVMFFDDPPVAFARLREALREGGRMGFCCWRSPAENLWLSGGQKIAARFVEMPPAPEPHSPGPFGLFDRDRTFGILQSAGWRDVAIDPVDVPMTLGDAKNLDEALDFLVRLGPIGAALAKASPDTQAQALDALREFFAPHLRDEGVIMPGAIWIVSARG